MGASLLTLAKSIYYYLLFYYSFQTKKVRYVYPLSETTSYLFKQNKFATNWPISFIFNSLSRDMSSDHNLTLRHKRTSRFTGYAKTYARLSGASRNLVRTCKIKNYEFILNEESKVCLPSIRNDELFIKQSKFATNWPISFIFISLSRDHNCPRRDLA